MRSAETVRTSVTRSLSKFRTDYIDLYLIHWPGPGPARRKLAWQELEQFYKYCTLNYFSNQYVTFKCLFS